MKDHAIVSIALDQVRILNPRTRARRQHQGIVDSIAAVGLKRPITVSERTGRDGHGSYDLVCGQGRLEAVRLLGHAAIPAIVVHESEDECMMRSLVENLARRNHTTQELLRDVAHLRENGCTDEEVASRTGLTAPYVRDILMLLDQGEDQLLEAVERGIVTVRLALVIARCGDAQVQRALAEAYAEGSLKGKQLSVVRKLIQRRDTQIRASRTSSQHKGPAAKLSPEQLKKMYVQESARQRVLVKRANLTHTRLALIVEVLRDLLSDTDFTDLLRREGFTTVPQTLQQRIDRQLA